MLKDSPNDWLAPPFPPLPMGQPLAVFRLDALPSWNEIIDEFCKHPAIGGKITSVWRRRGYDLAIAWAVDSKLQLRHGTVNRARRDLIIVQAIAKPPVFVFARYWRQAGVKDASRGSRRRDCFNLALKQFADGLTDAGFWEDDNEEIAPDVWAHYAGTRTIPKVEVYVYGAQ